MPTSIRKQADMDADRVKFRGHGFAFTATKNSTTDHDYKIVESRLFDGIYFIPKNHVAGDSVVLQVVDVDGILGFELGLVLDEFATDWYLDEAVSTQLPVQLSYSAEIVAGLYIRIKYTSTGTTNDVSTKCNFFLHKFLA